MKSGNSESLAGERNVYRYHCEGKINFLAFMPILVTLSSVGLLASSCAGSYFKKIQCQSSQPRACGGNFAVGHLSISGVSGVLNDSASNTAIAKFTVKIEPTRFYDSVCSNERCPAIGQATAEGTAKFKRYDEGWRIESVEYPLIY